MTMDLSYYPCAIISCGVWLFLYKYVAPAFSSYFFPVYNNFTRTRQIDWDTRVNSTVHSLIVSFTSLYAVMYDKYISEDPVWGDSYLVKYNCAIVVGYMVYDCIIMLVHFKETGDLFSLFHHAASVYAFWFVITYGSLTWFANFRLLAEFSTPFVNQRWFFDVLEYPKNSKSFLINGITMAVMFFLVRIAIIPIYWHKVYSVYGTPAYLSLGRIWHVLTSSCFVLDAINIYWMYRIFLGAQKVLKVSFDKNRNIANKPIEKES